MKKSILNASIVKLTVACFVLLNTTIGCGPKDSVVEEDSNSKDSGGDPRSRLTGGSSLGGTLNYCRYPLDLGTTVDPRRPGLTQTVLTSPVDTRCAQSRDARITIRTRQKLTLAGRYTCRTGAQSGEQICLIATSEILSQQRTSLTIPVTADDTLRNGDVEASVELY
ncbi:MAG: hypothetical protein FJY29_11005 [Betaproteobacteria bacterium]|nr:hypothetical protein [Betaproteobacteria bacterium]